MNATEGLLGYPCVEGELQEVVRKKETGLEDTSFLYITKMQGERSRAKPGMTRRAPG